MLDLILAIEDLTKGYIPVERKTVQNYGLPTSTILIMALLLMGGLLWFPLGISPLEAESSKLIIKIGVSPKNFLAKKMKILRHLKIATTSATAGMIMLTFLLCLSFEGTRFQLDDQKQSQNAFVWGAVLLVLELACFSLLSSSGKRRLFAALTRNLSPAQAKKLKAFVNRKSATNPSSNQLSSDLSLLDEEQRSTHSTSDPTSFGGDGQSGGGGSSGNW